MSIRAGWLSIALLALCSPALAQEATQVHVIVEIFDFEAVTGVEFRIDNLPYEQCTISAEWVTEYVIGDLGWDISLAFLDPLPGPLVYIGTISFWAHTDVGENYMMTVMPGLVCDCLVVVDENFDTHPANGTYHHFNCIPSEEEHRYCSCGHPFMPIHPTIGSTRTWRPPTATRGCRWS